MKAVLILDQDADVSQLPEDYQSKVKMVTRAGQLTWFYPAGTEFEGKHALHLCTTGQAEPADEECSKALGMSPVQLRVVQRKYAAAMAGIKGKNDHDLFMAGVITGYAPESTDEHPVYLHGPKWDEFQAAKQAEKSGEDDLL